MKAPSLKLRPQLIQFTRWPAAGKVKTRLIPALGSIGAMQVHRHLSEHTLAQAREAAGRIDGVVVVRIVGGSLPRAQRWLGGCDAIGLQGSGSLGVRMHRTLTHALVEDSAPYALLFGSDIPDLSAALLETAAAALAACDVVLGPASDGGYYLIGLKKPQRALFQGISWGGPAVLADTMRRAAANRLSVALLPTLSDLDRPEDLARWPDLAAWPITG